MTLRFDLDGVGWSFEPEALVVAGYTGADAEAVQHHIDELADEGVAPPPRVPMYWSMPAAALTQASSIEVPSRSTSGEVELALIVDGDDILVGVGSDHTCREAEATDIRLSKLICPTPISRSAWRWDEIADHWGGLELSSTIEVDGRAEPYQQALAIGNQPPLELLDGIPWADEPARRFVLLCGTVPAIGGIRPAGRFTGQVTDPSRGRSLGLDYRVSPAPALAT